MIITRERKNGANGEKKPYSREEDEMIAELYNSGTTTKLIKEALSEVGFSRTEASLMYRIYRVLLKHESFDDIRYKVTVPVKKEEVTVPVKKEEVTKELASVE